MADDANPRVFVGANNPPEPTPFDAVQAHIDGLMEEARLWLTGAEITTDAQADEIKRLKDDFKLAHKAADDARIAENVPFDDGKAAVQAKYAPLIADTKKVRGKTVLALEALNQALTPWLRKKEQEAAAEARRLREEAEELARVAAAAVAESAGDLEAREAAEEIVTAASIASADARRAEVAKVHVKGEGRAEGLRSYWSPVMTDRKAALLHYVQDWPPEIIAALQGLAEVDVRAGKRQIPGFDVQEERRVA
ncbi:hypothetical protein [Phenylobacterium sp.]|uniref:hypothetical protein n=1 Tax=Phenylobacterium sp. TaxID=1871053 RepID=UPI002724F6E9|nr:hypothetical protein [Phenylobacterium sp.]MDO8800094.1 hypothetical protein [Phenylobacterium sp.]